MSFMGRRIGTVGGKTFYAHRVRTPLFTQRRALQSSNHYRFLLQCQYGQFWSPYIRVIEPLIWNGTQVGVRLVADPLVLEHFLELINVTIIDLTNQEMVRPTNFSLPWEAVPGQTVQFTWRARWRRS